MLSTGRLKSAGKNLLCCLGMLLVVTMVFSSCSTHKHSVKREKTHSKSKKDKEREKEEEKFLTDLSRHLKGDEKKVIKEAETWLGTPYKYAEHTKGKGTDCSGFIMMVFKDALDCALPRNSAKQADFCKKIKKNDVKPGDLVFFATGKDPKAVSHVGIMVNKEQFIHASSSKGVVISSLENRYYSQRFLSFGRVPCMKH